MQTDAARAAARSGGRWRRVAYNACVVCAIALIPACGDGGGGNPTSPTPTPTTRVILQGNASIPAPEEDGAYFVIVTVTDPASGQWEATVDWAIATNTLWMWVADAACTVEKFAQAECPFDPACQCQIAVRSETATPKPRVMTIPNAPGGTRTLIVANLGPREDDIAYTVRLTSSGLVPGEAAPRARNGPTYATGRKPMPGLR